MKVVLFVTLSLSVLFASGTSEDKHRYFGGLSEGELNLPKSVMLTPSTVVTEEVFAAESKEEVEVAIIKQKEEQVKSANVAKDFVLDKTGHLFGGLSEGKLNFK
jgi:hypothetical protein